MAQRHLEALRQQVIEARAAKLGLKRRGYVASPNMPGIQALDLFEEGYNLLLRGLGKKNHYSQIVLEGSVKRTNILARPSNPIPSPQPSSMLRRLFRLLRRK